MKLISSPAEKTTAATDIVLAIVAFGGIVFLRHLQLDSAGLWKINIWSAAIGFIGLAATLGAVAHGVVLSRKTHRCVWLALNMALSLAISLFVVGVVYDLWGAKISFVTLPIFLTVGLGFYLMTLIYPGIFFLFIIYEVVALVFALGAYIIIATYKIMPGAWLMATGVFCSIIAAVIQTKKSVTLTFIWRFDHNGVYHLVQALGLMFFLIGLRWSMLY
jgi:hypothetical protein